MTAAAHTIHHHHYSPSEITEFGQKLVAWYEENKRPLPWRLPSARSENKAYQVWVSEIMAQQTQVATVIPYFERWMKRWPSISDLASANIEEVNEVWKGLGYYSRARRLFESAQLVMKQFDGALPQDVDGLMKLPGVGRYTAGAIASIAFNQRVPLVDGNVQRVLTRHRAIAGDLKEKSTNDLLWQLATSLVEREEQPGILNQAIMELGATCCTPSIPKCNQCPISAHCMALKESKTSSSPSEDSLIRNHPLSVNNCKNKELDSKNSKEQNVASEIELCHVCATRPTIDAATSSTKSQPSIPYPYQSKKAAKRQQTDVVFLIQKSSLFLVFKRSEKGLLAGLWSFPSIPVSQEDASEIQLTAAATKFLSQLLQTDISPFKRIGNYVHEFTHIRQLYEIVHVVVDVQTEVSVDLSFYSNDSNPLAKKHKRNDENVSNRREVEYRWLERSELHNAAIPTAFIKAYDHLQKHEKQGQKKIRDFFKTN